LYARFSGTAGYFLFLANMKHQGQIKEQLKNALSATLPGKAAHVKMLPDGRPLDLPAGESHMVKRSSVLLLLYPDNGELFICLIKRPDTMKHHAGQVAFPGGRVDAADVSELEAALRETEEEVGVGAGQIEILGTLSKIYLNISRFLIQPFVGWAEKKPEFVLNPHEVIRLIQFPACRFFDQQSREYAVVETLSGKMEVPCYRFDDEIIWGATAMILAEFSDVLKSAPYFQDSKSR